MGTLIRKTAEVATGPEANEQTAIPPADKSTPIEGPPRMDAAARLAHLRSVLASDGVNPSAVATPDQQSPLARWRARYAPQPRPQVTEPPPPLSQPAPPQSSPIARRILKSALGLFIVAVAAFGPLQNFFQASSVEAIVNAPTITLRSPIDGELQSAPSAKDMGTPIPGGSSIRIVDRSADPSRVEALEKELEQLQEESDTLTRRLDSARTLLENLRRQGEGFATARISQLTVRREQLEAEAAVATDRAEGAKLAAQRTAKLATKGAASEVQLEQTQRDTEIAAQSQIAAIRQVEAVDVELNALTRGIFVGDSYNDRPQSLQRADELQREVADLSAGQSEREIRIARIQARLHEEQVRYALLSQAEVALPGNARIYEILTAPGERVRKGQDLLRVLDCSGAVVTAVVGETVYNTLRIGTTARFLPRGSGPALAGRVVGLTGASAGPANFAILPSSLSREAYHVTVDVPALARQDECAVGRTGRVIFNEPPTAADIGLRP